MNELLIRLTSRKFILAVASGVFGCLAAAGVVPADAVAKDAALAGPLAFILVEGAADLIERHNLSKQTLDDAVSTVASAIVDASAPAAAPAPVQPSA